MERLARLLPFRQFGRLRRLRKLVPCSVSGAPAVSTPSLFDSPDGVSSLPSSLPAFARVSLNAGLNMAEPERRAPVRVYHGPSRLIMVGTMEAVCRMIDRCIADEANVHGAVFES
ncbi:hypothetical protein ACTJLC_01240 [Paraburkholderia sp. 22099]|jgi:hypothetical protein|uniref:Uncharacterized protein n=1 Tax=Paraburkholderia terricola TaxID=169427 RepID=A0A1M6IWT4_9BURK|nr:MULTISPECIES: hypothetical protein [Paraburkholderia]ORC49275.1 hypothetical protein B2G74_14715 [Burkholderia sp. A27]AXE92207.1 hypothetical protein CUJ90_07470 [Paraburkholderia terricola]MDR6408329.1 hypothetical protein [Paraburkholderia terricola]MDR6447869.1 hypothetical protein [Paraburkholderia terricola]MDR6481749.1 hypothetical protein [Paraburkholderia terricola]